VEKVETAIEPRFQEHFIDAMALPHRTASYAKLAAQVALPERLSASDEGGKPSAGRRRRRSRARQEV
jgi:uncharacterized 2Fe-2S/4Fe-4S cluster protein (DUF4445 family)